MPVQQRRREYSYRSSRCNHGDINFYPPDRSYLLPDSDREGVISCSGSSTSSRAEPGSSALNPCHLVIFIKQNSGFFTRLGQFLQQLARQGAEYFLRWPRYFTSSRTPPKAYGCTCELVARAWTAPKRFLPIHEAQLGTTPALIFFNPGLYCLGIPEFGFFTSSSTIMIFIE